MNPILSIIVPNYNGEKYLKHLLDLLCMQHVSSDLYEVIMVDDGSTDNSVELIQSYLEKRENFHLIQIENSGVSTARNNGIKAAIGDYIWFVDSDDFVAKNSIQLFFEQLKRFENIDMLIFKFQDVDDKDNSVFSLNDYNTQVEQVDGFEALKYGKSVCNRIYKKELITNNNILFSKDVYIGEDLAFNVQFSFFAKKTVFFDNAIYYRRLSEQSATRSHSCLSKKRHIDSTSHLIEFYKKLLSDKKYCDNKELLLKYIYSYCVLRVDLLFTIYNKSFINETINKVKKDKKYLTMGIKKVNVSRRRQCMNMMYFVMPFKLWFWLMWLLHNNLRK